MVFRERIEQALFLKSEVQGLGYVRLERTIRGATQKAVE